MQNVFSPIQINVGREHIHGYIYRQLLSANVEKWLLFRIVKIPKDNIPFLFFISVSLWSCLLWIILCCYFPPWYSKVSRPYFSSSTVERMRNELWWSCCHGCLSPLSIGVIPPAADTGEKKIFSFRLYWFTLNEMLL